ncbi:polyribonucleotide nucleotidyltransferase [Gallibacter intestinalis]|uniref:Polyribonucleotide nucleotidyltransferase n=1 Tax=Gallibacter intestinalis TaxID=2779356 RepID=A0ABR9QYV4_9FIRM|nr:polyribonucleotide nucleotidyltransferase [Gallibacter intestinalis]MBE5035755.1 polyribonucleotide nucleotidyltransferase [Gallibacter intestinalis]
MKYEDYKVYRTAIGGKLLELEIGKVCEMANGQVMVRYGDTVVNVTAVASKQPRPDIDFFPLSCDYEEKMYAAGKIPGGFIKREGRPSEKAILNSRLMDRPLRPLFPKGFYNDVQVVATVMSVDLDAPSEIAAMIGSSVALSISDIPWDGPTASVLVGMVDGEFVINPGLEQREKSDLHLVVSGTKDAIMMVEAGANEVPEETILDAIMFAHEEIKEIVSFIEDIVAEIGKPKMEVELYKVPEEIETDVRAYAEDKMREAVHTVEKMERLENMDAVEVETQEHFAEKYPESEKDIASVLYNITKEQVRSLILDDGIRPDNRKYTEIRPIWIDTGILPRAHGSGLFKRGQTQALSVATLGTISEEQRLDGLTEQTEKRYMHHYNFPPYSVGEARPMRSPGRREIGHGALAERAILPVLPSVEEFPYAIRVVSEILSSNGSTSQASVCGSCLALMDAGVPIKAPVAGIAMGLVERVEEDGSSTMAILSDIQGMEDFLGDMDFKVAGTAKGVTAIQMDIKVHGLSKKVLQDALKQAKDGRMHIMQEMLAEIPEPRKELSPYAPRIITMQVDPDKIRIIIGPGGKTINAIVEKTGVKIDIDDEGQVFIASTDMEGAEAARKEIELLTKDVEVGEVYEGKVTRIMNFGAFIEILPGKEGLLHISKMAKGRVEKVEDVMNVGDIVKVKVTEIDSQDRINLSRKELL